MVELLRERVFAIACGYPDCNDAAKLRTDPVMKLAYALADAAIEVQARLRKSTRRITIDMDPTEEDPTYGSQQMTFFNAFYDNWCYLPMVTTLQFDKESEQWLVAPVLRPDNHAAEQQRANSAPPESPPTFPQSQALQQVHRHQ